MIPEAVIKDWVGNKTRIQNKLNRLNKRLKKYNKQKAHYEMRMRAIVKYEKENKASKNTNSNGLSGEDLQDSTVQGDSGAGSQSPPTVS